MNADLGEAQPNRNRILQEATEGTEGRNFPLITQWSAARQNCNQIQASDFFDQ